MAQTIILKHSLVVGRKPTSLAIGEVALNVVDKKLYINDGTGNVVDLTEVKSGAVDTSSLVNGSVTTEKLADGAVTTNKIGDFSVTFSKLEDNLKQHLKDVTGRYVGSFFGHPGTRSLHPEIAAMGFMRGDFFFDLNEEAFYVNIQNGGAPVWKRVGKAIWGTADIADGAITLAKLAPEVMELVDSKIAAEKVRAEAAEAGLQAQIDHIVGNTDPSAIDSLVEVVEAFKAADGNLNGAIQSLAQSAGAGLEAERVAREAGDAELRALIASNTSTGSILSVDLTNETVARQADVAALRNEIQAEAAARAQADNDEAAARTAADQALQSAIAGVAVELNDTKVALLAESAGRNAADTALSGRIDTLNSMLSTETAARQAGDVALQGSIDGLRAEVNNQLVTERDARVAADNQLSADISTEAAARAAGDAALGVRIDGLTSTVTAEVARLDGAVATELARAQAAEAALAARVSAMESVIDGGTF